MYRMTARNIAVISPLRQNFPALTKAGEFAAAIIDKYSGTEAFPFNGEALIYFNAMKERLGEEKSLRDKVGYTINLLIVRRLILDGKVTDPTVTKQFLSSVSERVERNLTYLRISDNNAYTRISEAISYINDNDSFLENLITSEITEDNRSFRYSSVDMTKLEQRFFGEHSGSYAYSGNYIYNTLSKLVYRREDISGDASRQSGAVLSAQNLPVINAGDTDYSYSTENLTYKTENDISESTDIRNEHNVQSINTTQQTAETTVSAPVTNVVSSNAEFVENRNISPVTNVTETSSVFTENTEINPETVINTSDTNYSYNSENLTYKTENEISESTDIRNEQNVQNINKSQQTAETIVSAPVTNVVSSNAEFVENRNISPVTNVTETSSVFTENTEINPETVINTSDTNYSYNSENLTYKTENEISESTDIRNEQNVQNINTTQQGAETTVSAPVTNVVSSNAESVESRNISPVTNVTETSSEFTENTEINPETVINTGDTNYSYNSENLTYKTEGDISESTDIRNEQNVQNINTTQQGAETTVSVPVTNVVSSNAEFVENRNISPVTNVTGTSSEFTENTEINPETVINTGDTNYSYNSENLTYKTEGDISENTDIRNEHNVQNINKTQQTAETTVSAPVMNVASSNAEFVENRNISPVTNVTGTSSEFTENKEINPETVINTGDTNYSYNSENLTYKTEGDISESTDIRNEQNVQNINTTQQSAETTVSAPVTNVVSSNAESVENSNISPVTNMTETSSVFTENTEINPETVINTGDTNYSYNSENLTYKTEGDISESTDIRNEQNVKNINTTQQSAETTVSAPVTNVTAVSGETTENTVSALVTNVTETSSEFTENTEINPETVINTGDTNYSYNSENLTYKTENEISESTDIRNEQNVQNINTSQQTAETTVFAPVTNVVSSNAESVENSNISPVTNVTETSSVFTENTEINPETVINTGDTNYSYNSENLTYKTENEISENTDIRNEQNVQNINTTQQSAETTVSAPITNVTAVSGETTENTVSALVTNVTGTSSVFTENTEINSETVINTGDTNYGYNTENLTYKTEGDISESTDIRNEQNVHNIQSISTIQQPTEPTVSAPAANIISVSPDIIESTEIIPESASAEGETNYSYSTEDLTYKTEAGAPENTEIRNERNIRDIPDGRSASDMQSVSGASESPAQNREDGVPTLAETIAEVNRRDTEKAGDLEQIGLLVMNTFLSGGSEYMTSVKEKYVHKRIPLIPAVSQPRYNTALKPRDRAAVGLLNSPESAFGIISYAVGMLTADRELSPGEREIYNSSVTKVYLDHHGHQDGNTGKMLAGMDRRERTEVLSLIVNRLAGEIGAGDEIHAAVDGRTVHEPLRFTDRTSHTTLRTVLKKIVDGLKKINFFGRPGRKEAQHKPSAQREAPQKTVRRQLPPAVPRREVTEPETRLLRLLSEDSRGDTVTLIGNFGRDDTIASKLRALYFGIPYVIPAEKLLMNRVEKAAYMPVLMEYTVSAPQNEYIRAFLRRISDGTNCYRSLSVESADDRDIPARENMTVVNDIIVTAAPDERIIMRENTAPGIPGLPGETPALHEPMILRETAASREQAVPRGTVILRDARIMREQPLNINSGIPTIITLNFAGADENAPDITFGNEYRYTVLPAYSPGGEEHILLRPMYSRSAVNNFIEMTAGYERAAEKSAARFGASAMSGILGKVPLSAAVMDMPSGIPTIITLNYANRNNSFISGDNVRNEYTILPPGAAEPVYRIYLKPMYSRETVKSVLERIMGYERAANRPEMRSAFSPIIMPGETAVPGTVMNIYGDSPEFVTLNYTDNRQNVYGDNIRNEYAAPAAGAVEKIYKILLRSVYSRETVKNILETVSEYRNMLEKTAERYSVSAMSGSPGRSVRHEPAVNRYLNIPAMITQNHVSGVVNYGGDVHNEYTIKPDTQTVSNYRLLMKSIYSRDTVKNAIDKLTEYRKAAGETEKERKQKRKSSGSHGTSERIHRKRDECPINITNITNITERGERAAAGTASAGRTVYAGSGNNAPDSGITVNSVYPEYELPVTVMSGSPVAGNVRLLPVYALDGVILPRRGREMRVNSGDRHRSPAPHIGRTVMAGKKPVTMYREERMILKNAGKGGAPGYEIIGENDMNVSMLTMMPETEPLRYRDNAAMQQSAAVPAASAAAADTAQQPSHEELVRQFGNLIEGAEPDLTYSFDPGRRGISEVIAAVTDTAEKVAVNSKLIEEIREKQLKIESETLKSSDLNKISENTIKKLRGSLRLDRSRFS